MSISIRPQMTPIGPVHVRMTGVVRGDQKGPGIGIVNAPTAAEATAELHRVARVAGAEKVVSVAADYRRAALAGGTNSTQWRIEVQAWGTAMAPAKPEAAEEPQDPQQQDADKARDAEADKKAREAQAKGSDDAKAHEAAKTDDAAEVHKAQAPAAPAPAPAPVAEAAPAPAPAPSPVAEPASASASTSASAAAAPESPPVSPSER